MYIRVTSEADNLDEITAKRLEGYVPYIRLSWSLSPTENVSWKAGEWRLCRNSSFSNCFFLCRRYLKVHVVGMKAMALISALN